MPNSTTNYSFNLPLVNNATDADLWGGQLNSNWTSADTVIYNASPIGQMVDFAGTAAPTYWMDCDGAAVSRTTYSALFTAISTTWGVGDGSTTFNLPDFQRRAAVGSGGSGTGTLGNSVGDTGGAETESISISEANLPSSLTMSVPTGNANDAGTTRLARGGSSGTASTSISFSSVGSASAISADIMQPGGVVLKIIYAGV